MALFCPSAAEGKTPRSEATLCRAVVPPGGENCAAAPLPFVPAGRTRPSASEGARASAAERKIARASAAERAPFI